MKTLFHVPKGDRDPEHFKTYILDCANSQQKNFVLDLLLQYDGKRAKENYSYERLRAVFDRRVKNALIVEFKGEVVLVICLAFFKNWLLLTRSVKFKFLKEPLLLSVCIEPLMDFCRLNKLDGFFLTFNKYNLDYLKRAFNPRRDKRKVGWLWDKVFENVSKFEYDLTQTVIFNSVEQYVVKTKSEKPLII